MIIKQFCRTCDKLCAHVIQFVNDDNPEKDFAKVKCIHCTEPAFVVECEKGTNPTSESLRVEKAA